MRLTDGPGPVTTPSWSPDGRHVAFAAQVDGTWDLYVVRACGGDSVQVTADDTTNLRPVWLPLHPPPGE